MNRLHTYLTLLIFLTVLGGLVFCLIRECFIRRDIRVLFSRGECHGKNLLLLTSALAATNARCRDYTFGVGRAGKILFREQYVWVVLGPVGTIAWNKFGIRWSSVQNLYALADGPDQIAWMGKNSDVFSPVCADPDFPVFWVNRSNLISDNSLHGTTGTSDNFTDKKE